MDKIIITGRTLTLEELAKVCREDAAGGAFGRSRQNITASRKVVDTLVENDAVVYGITTGFGKFSNVVVKQDECKLLQKNLIITHAVGAGNPFPRDVVRGIMLLRVNNLAKGFSGTRLCPGGNPGGDAEPGRDAGDSGEGFLGRQRRSGPPVPYGAAHAGARQGRVPGAGHERCGSHGQSRYPHRGAGRQGGSWL